MTSSPTPMQSFKSIRTSTDSNKQTSVHKVVTRDDVAKQAGVSIATVSYVVNNGPRPVSAATRQKVIRAIKELGYRPNLAARSLAGGKSNTFAFIAPNITNPFIAEIAHALEHEAHNQGKLVLFGDSGDDHLREAKIIEAMLARQVDGIIYMGVTETIALDSFTHADIPVVVITHSGSDGHFPSVRIDEEKACYKLTEHIIEHNRATFGILTGPANMLNSHIRLQGMQNALTDHGKIAQVVGWEAYSRSAGYEWANRILRLGSFPAAVVTGNERQAIGVMAAISDAGWNVPTQVAIAALNGSATSAYLTPALTTIRQPLGQMAKQVFQILNQPNSFTAQGYYVGFDLAVGQSCGCTGITTRTELASWTVPNPDTLDSAAGLYNNSENNFMQFTDF